MPEGLIAICGSRSEPCIKRVLVDDAIANDVRQIFRAQEDAFMDGCQPVPFDGNWMCGSDEYMTLPISQPAQVFIDALSCSEPHLPPLNSLRLEQEEIRGLAIAVSGRLLVQQYSSSQTLRPGRTFVPGPDGVHFRRLDASALRFDNHLTCVTQDGVIKFKSVKNLSRIIDTTEIVREATNEEAKALAGHSLIVTPDLDAFLDSLGQVTRRLVHSIHESGVLEGMDVPGLQVAAGRCGYDLPLSGDGRIAMPSGPKEIRELLQFLNENRFRGAITGQRYVTNSRREVR